MSNHRIHHIARRRAVLAAAILVSLLLAACGSGGGTAGPTATAPSEQGSEAENGQICDIVSDEAVAAVLDAEVVRREPFEEPGTVGCTKGPELGDVPHYVNVYVLEGGALGGLIDEAGAEGDSQPVEGLGDRAVYLPDAGTIIVSDGDDALSVQVIKAGVPGSLDDCSTIAADMLGRRG